ncbi:AMED_5909 family protein [Actinosynnema mirum]|uniref:Uncharacterized protein n=1 Tax=Actinosynnema mirum (strain ATCC 29888 / DSM 43827 / JCM 3225 / NBRC 14064 / NCIMB 13271 / NRRL B-12336 / IMRU 3971 / 101) TaxID=446462 RepID=C6WME6_ACTMD|nr:AMED_5909 family protein [Actinosynnema mirum]ACU34880.1 hypothetical protein Amir_0920 [Actinosynnema mirum DSM 43827]
MTNERINDMTEAQRQAVLWKAAFEATRLRDAHELLTKVMPEPDAAPAVLRDFYLRSASVYSRIAEVDRHHHHEALYWADRERKKGEEITLK